jgi:hypothetical protein
MAEILYQMFGSASNTLVELYLANQVLLNTLVVIYGSILAIVHQNLHKIEAKLLRDSGSKDWNLILGSLVQLEESAFEEWAGSTVRFRYISSPYFFGIYRLTKKNLVRVLVKKHGASRGLLDKIDDSKGESL